MESLKSVAMGMVNSPIGALAGAAGAFYVAKKWAKVENKWFLAGLTLVGAIVGSGIEYKIKAGMVKPAAAIKK